MDALHYNKIEKIDFYKGDILVCARPHRERRKRNDRLLPSFVFGSRKVFFKNVETCVQDVDEERGRGLKKEDV